jgi:hypothetical protein
MTLVERTLEPSFDACRFEHHCPRADDALGVVRRRFFEWLERRSFDGRAREELLSLLTAVVSELTAPRSVAFTVTAEDAGENVLLRFDTEGVSGWNPVRLGRCVAAVDRLAGSLSLAVVPLAGERHLLVDVTLPA